MNHNRVMLKGRHFRKGGYFQYELPDSEIIHLASLIKQCVTNRNALRLQIAESRLDFVFGNDIGEAKMIDETVEVRSNPYDLLRLAEELHGMASASISEQDCFEHIHLEPVYIAGNDNVSDIVIARDCHKKRG